jgi:hypothetical protein
MAAYGRPPVDQYAGRYRRLVPTQQCLDSCGIAWAKGGGSPWNVGAGCSEVSPEWRRCRRPSLSPSPLRVQGINKLTFTADCRIIEMISAQNEVVPLQKSISPEEHNNQVEVGPCPTAPAPRPLPHGPGWPDATQRNAPPPMGT